MKKLLVLCCLVFLACPVWACKEGGVRFGLLGGFTSSSTNVEKMDLSSVSLYHAGVALHVPVGPTFAVQFQLQYQVKGATLDKMDTSPASLQSLETKVGYLELPVQLQLRIPLPVVRPYLFGEPFLGYALTKSGILARPISSGWNTAWAWAAVWISGRSRSVQGISGTSGPSAPMTAR